MAKSIMIQGTGSNVGKSMLVAGIIRALSNRGLSALPFKPQNMSNNAAVTSDSGEIGRAQALQARAARVPPHTDMNPVLLKPQSSTGAQVVVQGQVLGASEARDFIRDKPTLMPAVMESFARLSSRCDVIVVEGAGSPAETNLRVGDIANMGFATRANVPVILTGDIDRGGVIAQVVGTQAVMEAEDNDQVKGFIINKFRGDVTLFDEGRDDIVNRTGWPCLGVIPWFDKSRALPAEDIMDLESRKTTRSGKLKIAVPRLPRISNFDDLDPLLAEPNVQLTVLEAGTALPPDTDVVLMVGSKSTISDLADLRRCGWDIDIAAHIRRGGHVLGICGGYQMLGGVLADPEGIEGPTGTVDGLGHLQTDTVLRPAKTLALRSGYDIESGAQISGYEMHIGITDGPDGDRPWLVLEGKKHGAASKNGRVKGCYVHGLFASDAFRAAWLAQFDTVSGLGYEDSVEDALDELAQHLETHLDMAHLLDIAQEPTLS